MNDHPAGGDALPSVGEDEADPRPGCPVSGSPDYIPTVNVLPPGPQLYAETEQVLHDLDRRSDGEQFALLWATQRIINREHAKRLRLIASLDRRGHREALAGVITSDFCHGTFQQLAQRPEFRGR